MRNNLPDKPFKNESGVINMDDKDNAGTHWTAYVKNTLTSYILIVLGIEFIKYMKDADSIRYNRLRYQKNGASDCGRLCILFLRAHT
jgi:hypothetical protein